MVKLVNRAMMTTQTTGTGNVTLLAAVDGYHDFDTAGVGDGDTVPYTIEDGEDFEIGLGTYNSVTKVLTRVVAESSNNNAKINLSGDARVFVTVRAEDIIDLQTQIDGKSASGHGHAISDTSGLQAALDGKATSAQGAKADSAVQPVSGHGLYPDADKTKLAGIASQATKNATDAQLRDRTTHTGAQPISTVTGLQTALNDKLDADAAAVSADKLTTPRSIALSGDVSGSTSFDGSGNVTISATVANNSHTHTIANIGGLQSALDGKATSAQGAKADAAIPSAEKGALNGVAELDGTGKVPAAQLPSYVDDVEEYANFAAFPGTGEDGKIYVDEAQGDIYRWSGSAYIQINDAVSSADQATKLATARTISLSGDVSGSASFDGSANATINVTVADDSHAHTIANVDGLQAALDGKSATSHTHPLADIDGLSVGSSSFRYDNVYGHIELGPKNGTWSHIYSGLPFYFNQQLHVLGSKVFHDAYHPNADKLTTGRTISLSGDVSGSATFDGSSNVTINATIADDSHNHTIANVDGLQGALDGKLASGAKAVDSDKLDGINSSQFARVDVGNANLPFNPTMGAGIRFWNSDAYKIYMSSTPDGTWGGDIGEYSDYLMYFEMTGGTNRGFGFKNNGAMVGKIGGNGDLTLSGEAYVNANQRVFADNYHPNADKLTTGRSIALSGDVSGSATFDGSSNVTINATIADDSHNHTIANVDGLQTALNGKEIERTPGEPHSNLGDPSVREMALFDAQFNNKIDFYDPNMFWIETSSDGVNWTETADSDTHKRRLVGGDGSAGIVIPHGTPFYRIRMKAKDYVYLNAVYFYWSGSGNTTKVKIHKKHKNSSDWQVHTNSEKSVGSWPGHLYLSHPTIAWHPNSDTTHLQEVAVVFEPNWGSQGNAISLYRMQWWGGYPAGRRNVYSTDEYGNVQFPGEIRANNGQRVFADDYHPNADSLTTGRTISLTGDASGAVSFDGSSNVSINVTVADDSHNHTIANVDGLQTALNGKLATGAKAADSDKLDGLDSSQFLRSDQGDTVSGRLNFTQEIDFGFPVNHLYATDGTDGKGLSVYRITNTFLGAMPPYNYNCVLHFGVDDQRWAEIAVPYGSNTGLFFRGRQDNGTTTPWRTIWHDANDGAGSGLDADKLDGLHASAFATSAQGGKADTAYGWGNHASAGYLTAVPFASQAEVDAGTVGNKAVAPDTLKQRLNNVGGSSYARTLAFGG